MTMLTYTNIQLTEMLSWCYCSMDKCDRTVSNRCTTWLAYCQWPGIHCTHVVSTCKTCIKIFRSRWIRKYKTVGFEWHIIPPIVNQRYLPMGKLRKPGAATKTRIFEATTRHTRRGPQIIHVPVPSTPQLSSRNSSPSKKRTWSPDAQQDQDDDSLPSFQEPRRSRRTGKVRIYLWILLLCADKLFRRKMNFSVNISRRDPNCSLSLCDMNLHLQTRLAPFAILHREPIDAETALVHICSAAYAAFPLIQTHRFIGFKDITDITLSAQISMILGLL